MKDDIKFGGIYYMLKKDSPKSIVTRGKPVMIITPDEINQNPAFGRVAIVPITRTVRVSESPFYVEVEWNCPFQHSCILSNEVFIADKDTIGDFSCYAPDSAVNKVKSCLSTFLEIGSGFEIDEGFVVSKDSTTAYYKQENHDLKTKVAGMTKRIKELEEQNKQLTSKMEYARTVMSMLSGQLK